MTPQPPISDPRWRAIVERDRRADGAFVYAVKTTGIYCRPSCPSRKPHMKNVEVFETGDAAERRGYRACKRCRPRADAPTDRRGAVAELCRFVDASEALPTARALAARAGWSPSHLSRVFREVTGMSPKDYIRERRAERVRAELSTDKSITRAMYDAGYQSSGRFYADAADSLGMSPRAYQNRGAGEQIRFAVGSTTLGEVVVAATDKGVCAVALGDDPDALVRDLEDRFSGADLRPGGGSFDHWVARIVGLIERPSTALELPLDVRGTSFQRRVWAALRAIPCGAVVSYSEIAAAIGAPSSSRAVARACGANPVAVAIPCHRVVRKDGSISGYRWGVERKRRLLARERGGSSKVDLGA
jgi:AraC family transcriptional regulator of adaptative response/methylated-DNA-[protein]-cysteine methyltransferase